MEGGDLSVSPIAVQLLSKRPRTREGEVEGCTQVSSAIKQLLIDVHCIASILQCVQIELLYSVLFVHI